MKKILIVCFALFMALAFSGVALAAPATYFDFNGDTMADTSLLVPNVGDSFSADLYFDFADSDSFGGLQSMGVQVTYDYTEINVTLLSVDPENWYIADKYNTWFDNSVGLASISGGRLTGLTGSPILLGTINFDCVGAGLSDLVMGELLPLNDGFDAFVTAGDPPHVFDKEILYGQAQVTQVNQVPVPGAIWLLGSGLLGLVGLRRRSRRA